MINESKREIKKLINILDGDTDSYVAAGWSCDIYRSVSRPKNFNLYKKYSDVPASVSSRCPETFYLLGDLVISHINSGANRPFDMEVVLVQLQQEND